MTKVIFNTTAALISLVGQWYDPATKMASDAKVKISIQTPSDSISMKPEIKKIFLSTKKTQQAS